MARSDPRRTRLGVAALGVLSVPLSVAACNGLIGLSDFEKVECTGLRCDDDGGGSDAPPDTDRPDAGEDAKVDAPGSRPVSWARWRMPNYVSSDAGADVDNPLSYSAGGGEVLDNVTKLAWLATVPDKTAKSFADAEALCAAQSKNGIVWRLPSRIELVTLLDLQRSPKIDPVFAETQPGSYWTSSPVRPFTDAPTEYWGVDFSNGGVSRIGAGATAFVRCVKGGL